MVEMLEKDSIIAKVLQKIKVPSKENLDIPRRNMPQIKRKHMDKFKDWLEDQKIKVKETSIPAKDLKPTQKDFNIKKVKELLDTNSEKLNKMLLVSKDNYILDGHHKWLAHINMDEHKKIKVMQVDLSAQDFLKKTKEFPKVRYKDLQDNEFKNTDPSKKYAITNKVLAKLKNSSSIVKLIKELALKHNKLTPENAVAYARNFEKYHNFKVPTNPKTKKTKMNEEDIILVELEGREEKDWYPVWIDDALGGMYGEY